MTHVKRILLMMMCAACLLALTGCGEKQAADQTPTVTIAYQGGIGYAPVHVMEAKGLIRQHYGRDVTVKFVKLDSGAAINEGIIGGTIDVGCMGVAPAISGVAAGIPYKVISNLCAQSHGLMSGDPAVTSLKDITPANKIALVNTGSIQHILLGMAAEKTLGDAHALDNSIQPMSHAEGMAALESGTVDLHLTSSPFIYQERDSGKYTELPELAQVWPSGNSFLVAMASARLAEDAPLFEAVRKAFADAIAFINDHPAETAQIEAQYLGLELATVEGYLAQEDCAFFPELRGAQTMADFMYRAGFIEKPVTMADFKYDGVDGQ